MYGNILSPSDGEYIGSTFTIKGVVSEKPKGRDLWVAHRRVNGGTYWPKEPKMKINNNLHFESIVYEGGAPGIICISLLLVDKSISNKFEDWFKKGHLTGSYEGIQPSEYDVKELTNVEVIYDKNRPLKLFYSYSHKDEKLRDSLEEHLSLLHREGYIEQWHDRNITAGSNLSKAISSEIEKADIILLLVSASFIASDYCYQIEMKNAIERHKEGVARVIPIIVRPVDWSGAPFSDLLALPKDGKAVTLWNNEDEAWLNVSKEIRNVVSELR